MRQGLPAACSLRAWARDSLGVSRKYKVELGDGCLDVAGAAIFVPEMAGEHAHAAAGLPAVPVLLKAMADAKDELRDRIEGCVSRNARDTRNMRVRGSLDAAAARLTSSA